MARQKCIEYDLLSPCYKFSKRGGCWFCPNAKLAEQREIKRIYPGTWAQFVSLEDHAEYAAYPRFNQFGKSLHEIDELLEREKE